MTSYSQDKVFASLPRTTRGMPIVLDRSPDGQNFVYCVGNSVIIRNVTTPSLCEIYTEHSTLTTVAKYSPSGFYIASGDQFGKVRLWDTTQKEHILKLELQPLSGAVRDISWGADNQRVAVVGEGRERFGHVFLTDTGTSNGNMSGQSKSLTSVDFRPVRPYRIASASEDFTVAIFQGPPFKFQNYHQAHTRFALGVRYQPCEGKVFASCGADGRVLLFDGLEGKQIAEFQESAGNAHKGGVYGLSWTLDGKRLLTASADKTCKLWDVETRTPICTFPLGSTIEDQQLGCICVGEHLLSVSLSGFVNYLDPNNPEKPIRVLKGHNKPITSVAMDRNKETILTGDSDGNIMYWDKNSGDCEQLASKLHKSQIQSMAVSEQGKLFTVAMDDKMSIVDNYDNENMGVYSLPLGSQPRSVSISPDGETAIVGCQKEVCIFKNGALDRSFKPECETVCLGLSPDKSKVAVGGEDNKLRIFDLNSQSKEPIKTLNHQALITSIRWSSDGRYLAACDGARRVVPYDASQGFAVAARKDWTFHTAKVNCLAWHSDNNRLCTGSLDTNVIVWDVQQSGEHPLVIKGAHKMSQITGIDWADPDTIVSVGQDSNVKQWKLQ